MPFPFRRTLHMRTWKTPDYDQRFNVPKRRWTAEPKDFVNLFCAVIYDLLWRILCAGEDVLTRDVATQRNPTQTSPLAVIMASIVPMNYAYVSLKGPAVCFELGSVYPYRSRYRKCRPRASNYGCPSRALKQPSVQISMFLWLADVRKRREGTLHFRPTVVP